MIYLEPIFAIVLKIQTTCTFEMLWSYQLLIYKYQDAFSYYTSLNNMLFL